jgi:outer membrane immunogenic protein
VQTLSRYRIQGILMNRSLAVSVGFFAFAIAVQPSLAADVPTRAPTYKVAAAPMLDWSGFYVGANAGYAWGRATATDLPASNGVCWADCGFQWGPDIDGFNGGLQAGWNVQVQNWVFGIEGDVGYLDLSGTAPDPNAAPALVETRGGWFGTLRGRAGVLVSPALLVYGTGGVVYADTRTNVFRAIGGLDTSNADPWGWIAGAGVETRVGHGWSLKLEYLYYDLGNDRVGAPIGGGTTQYFAIEQTGHILRVGLNYHFATGKAPTVVARY